MKLRFGVVGALLALALAGCGEGEDPSPPDASPSSAPTSATPSDEPSETVDPTKETAREFIRRWIRLGNEMQKSGKTDEYLAITNGECQSCNQFADRITGIYDAGGWVKTKGERVVSIRHDRGEQWTVTVNTFPTEFAESEGATAEGFEGGEVAYVVFIRKDDAGVWVITDYSAVAS